MRWHSSLIISKSRFSVEVHFQFLETMEFLFTLSILFLSIIQVKCQSNNSCGNQVIVTTLLENGSYIEAQELCKVDPAIGNITSYAGFFTVNKRCDSNLFFWFFPSLNGDWKDKPVVVWLQGGPGSPSTFGLFEEMGPLEFNGTLNARKYPWNNETNVVFIDQPVGSGFSYTSNITGQGCYPENLTASSDDLYQALYQFFQLFPNFIENKNKFIIAGESYAGKWIPTFAAAILENNKNASTKINITTLMIGGAYIHPIVQCIYSTYLYNIGLYDHAEVLIAQDYEADFLEYMQKEDWTNAAIVCGAQLGGIYDGLAGSAISVYNYIYPNEVEELYKDFVQSCEVRSSIHVGNRELQSGAAIQASLNNDTVQSVKDVVEVLLENVTIVFFNGQLDIICAYPLLENVLQNLTWSGQKDYLNATRIQWCIDEDQAGFYKGVNKLYEVFFRSSGHYVPRDQPAWAYQFFKSVVTGSAENPLHLLQSCDNS